MSQSVVKSALRKQIRETLKDIPLASIEAQSQKAVDRVLQTWQYRTASRLSVYLSIPGKEIQTKRIVLDALGKGKTVFVPYIHKIKGSSNMEMLALKSVEDYTSLEPDAWGIPSLAESSLADRENWHGGKGLDDGADGKEAMRKDDQGLDLIIMPGLAFDRKLNRLGHGKGFYDGFLRQYAARESRLPRLVALALTEQLLSGEETVPTNESDWPVDMLVTGNGNALTRER